MLPALVRDMTESQIDTTPECLVGWRVFTKPGNVTENRVPAACDKIQHRDSTVSTRPATVCAEHSSAITRRSEEARPHQARAAGSPSLASRTTARPVQVVSADVQGAPWSGTAVYRRSLLASYISRQQTETSICHSRRPRGQLLRHALWLPCIRCGGPKGMEPAASLAQC